MDYTVEVTTAPIEDGDWSALRHVLDTERCQHTQPGAAPLSGADLSDSWPAGVSIMCLRTSIEILSLVRSGGAGSWYFGGHPGSQITRGSCSAHQGSRSWATPVAITCEPQARLLDRSLAIDQHAPIFLDHTERRQVIERRAKAGAPDDRVDLRFRTVGPDNAIGSHLFEGAD